MTDEQAEQVSRRELLTRLAGVTLLGSTPMVAGPAQAGGHTMPEFIGYPPSDPELFEAINELLIPTRRRNTRPWKNTVETSQTLRKTARWIRLLAEMRKFAESFRFSHEEQKTARSLSASQELVKLPSLKV